MKELKNNVNTLLWLMVTLSVMVVFLTLSLSSCNSSVNPDQTKTITVTYGCSDNNGTIEAKVISSEKGKIEGNKIINLVSGDKIQFTAKPNNGYKFKEWIPKKLGNKETFELTVAEDLSISVEFEKGNNPPGPMPKETLTVDVLKKELKVKETDLIVSSYTGLGLKKEGDQFLYRYKKYKSDEKVNCSGKQLIKLMQDASVTVIDNVPDLNPKLSDKLENYSLGDVLKAKWNFARNSEKIVPEYKMFEFYELVSSNIPEVKGMYNLLKAGYRIAYKNAEMYVRVSITGTSYFADWTIAFVDKSKPNEVYVFSVGEIEGKSETDMKIKPYLLRDLNGYKAKGYKYLPALLAESGLKPETIPPEYYGMQLSNTYKFSLSSLLEGYLQYSLLDPNNGKYVLDKDTTVSGLSGEFIKDMLETCDVYMTIGEYKDQSGIYSTRDNIRTCWQNVLKLTEHEFWNKCFDKKP